MISSRKHDYGVSFDGLSIGDRLLVKPIEWYYKNLDEEGSVACGDEMFVEEMKGLCGKVVTVAELVTVDEYIPTELQQFKKNLTKKIRVNEDGESWWWTPEMFDSIVYP
jgi:hypothetical protein